MEPFDDIALVVIDAQKGFVCDATRPELPKLVELVNAWHEAKLPLVFTRMINRPDSPLQRLVGYTKMQGPPETDILDELQPFASTLVDKEVYSFFNGYGTKLVNERGWKTLAFCGFDTEACVLKSAFDAFDLGIVPLVVTDATASSFGRDKRKAGLEVAEAVIGERQMIDAQSLLALLHA